MKTLFADLQSVAQEHHWTLDELGEATGCGEQCGLCRPYLRVMLATGATVFHEILTAETE